MPTAKQPVPSLPRRRRSAGRERILQLMIVCARAACRCFQYSHRHCSTGSWEEGPVTLSADAG